MTMKDKLLFGTIGLLVGIVVMQWTMPSGQAIATAMPSGTIVATMGARVLAVDGNVWLWSGQYGWENRGPIPVPPASVVSIEQDNDWGTALLDTDGNYWLDDSTTPEGVFMNRGQPPAGPISTAPATFGKVKAQYQRKEAKP
jgi:hypothetical protein